MVDSNVRSSTHSATVGNGNMQAVTICRNECGDDLGDIITSAVNGIQNARNPEDIHLDIVILRISRKKV